MLKIDTFDTSVNVEIYTGYWTIDPFIYMALQSSFQKQETLIINGQHCKLTNFVFPSITNTQIAKITWKKYEYTTNNCT